MAGIEHVVSMEEFHSRKVVRREAGETSSGAPDDVQTQNISIQANTLAERFNMVKEAGENVRNQQHSISTPKIQKVIFLLRDQKDFEKYYEPRVASLGPIHHGKEKYQLGEKYKLVLTSEFVKGSDKDIKDLYKKIEENINDLRYCFEEEVTKKYDDETLAWLLFVDGCAILQYIYCATKNKFDELNIKTDSVAFAQQDLFLLENQLPYCLLKWLMSLSKMENELKESIQTYIANHDMVPDKKGDSLHSISMEGDPVHLLDLLRTRILGKPKPNFKIIPNKNKDQDWQSYRNVQELKAAGIRLRRNSNSCLSNISFTREYVFLGYLSLPPIIVDDSTRPKFLNLIAYEMCLDFKNDFGVTSYIAFLDSLIDEPNDVKILRKAGVLHNFLGSDEEVAKLFNEIGTDLVPNPETYKDVRSQIQKYYKNKWTTWMAQFYQNHFSSPWTIFAFCGVLVGLGLTAIQTWFTVHPAK
uniref:Uncharacterized protein n=1 Tax=Fagus sylvatica TaxID=28930 RepID=A0A2N9F2I4_FAGSY